MLRKNVLTASLIAGFAWHVATLGAGAQAMDTSELDKVLRGPVQQSMPEIDPTDAAGQADQSSAPALRDPIPAKKEHQEHQEHQERYQRRALDSQPEMPPVAPEFRRPQLQSNLAPNYDSLKTLTNFHMVNAFFLRGGQPTADDLAKLKSAGVKTVIDLRNEDVLVRQEAQQARSVGLSFVNIPLDVFNPPSDLAVRTFMKVVSDSAAANQPVYVHCLHGQDRTGTMVALYRIEHDGWNANQAYQEMLACGFRPGFSQLTRAVFAAGARAGRGGMMPSGGDIVTDMQNRFSRSH